MELAKAKKIVDQHIGWLIWAMALNQWKIHVEYMHLGASEEGQLAGKCNINRRYCEATISLDNDVMSDETMLLNVLRHELMHVFHSGFNSYRDMVSQRIEGCEFQAMDVSFHDAMEATVGFVERMLDLGLGMDAKEIVKRAKVHSRKR
jgi:hypothetical protein